MARVRIIADRVDHGGLVLGPGDEVAGKPANLQPLVDMHAAEWIEQADGAPAPEIDRTTWDWNTDEAPALIAQIDDPVRLRKLHDGELKNPRYPGGRKGVRNPIEERLGELRAEVETDLAGEPDAPQTFGDDAGEE